MKARLFFLLLLIFFYVFLGSSCDESSQKRATQRKTTSSNEPTGKYKILIKKHPLWVEVADDQTERSKGLMFRKLLGKDQGMLFVFEKPQELSFWMKNTFIPLDIAYVDENGVIVSIQQMNPLDDKPQYVSPKPALYAIETNQGWFKEKNISVGDKVEF